MNGENTLTEPEGIPGKISEGKKGIMENWATQLSKSVPNLLVMLIAFWIFIAYIEKRDKQFESTLSKTTKAIDLNTKMLGRVEHAIESR